MTNAELIQKIRAEIERRYNKHKYSTSITEMVYAEEDEQILSFLDTLESGSSEIPKDLEEAANEYAYRGMPDEMKPYVKPVGDEVVKNFIAGAKWDREQMLKEAVEGKVFMSFAPGHNQMVMADVDLPTNTKVRIIIVKEDEK